MQRNDPPAAIRRLLRFRSSKFEHCCPDRQGHSRAPKKAITFSGYQRIKKQGPKISVSKQGHGVIDRRHVTDEK